MAKDNDAFDSVEESKLQEHSTVKLEKTVRRKKKGKGSTAGAGTVLNRRREEILCGFCNNPMTMTENVNVVEVKGIHAPKAEDGSYLWESPGVAPGKVAGVLCDTCTALSETVLKVDGTSAVDIKHVVALRPDGTIRMINVRDLV